MYTYEDQLDSRYPNLVQNSFVYDADANRISESKGEENRRTVDEDELGEYLPQAVVAAEDKRFYEHYGADPTSIGRGMRRSSLVYPQIGWFKAAGTEVLRRVVQSGTPSFYHDLDSEVGRPSAGKTGTTDDFVDAWSGG
jgi:membrane peptidoglycan carboxypeptidase